jgi:hypothetical protein
VCAGKASPSFVAHIAQTDNRDGTGKGWIHCTIPVIVFPVGKDQPLLLKIEDHPFLSTV